MADVITVVKDALDADLANQGYQLWDVLYEPQGSDMVLRVLVDRIDGTISMDDLVTLTESIGQRLDAIEPDPFPAAYLMDISSPGAERELKRTKDFEWALEKTIHVDLLNAINEQTSFEGELQAVDDEKLSLMISVKGKRTSIEIPRSEIKLAHLAISQDRVLTGDEDFAWALHKFVQVSTYQKLDGVKDFYGELIAYDDEALTVELDDDNQVTIPRQVVARAAQTNGF